MEDNFERLSMGLSEDDFQDYKIAFRVIESLEQNDKIKPEPRAYFTIVRNYLANVIAQYTINNL